MIILCTKYCFLTSCIITTFLSVHYFIVLMEFLFLSFHRPAPGAAAGAAFLLQACFTRIVTRLLAIRTCAGPFSKGSEGLGRIKCSVFISGCPRTGSAGSPPAPGAEQVSVLSKISTPWLFLPARGGPICRDHGLQKKNSTVCWFLSCNFTFSPCAPWKSDSGVILVTFLDFWCLGIKKSVQV